MLQAFIITLREGVEAALIVGIALAYLAKIGRNDLRKSVYAALATAFAGSIAVAVVLSRLNLNQDIFEGWVMLVAAVFVVAVLFGVMFVKGSVKINLQKFFRVTTAILFLVAAQLLISGLHELSENGVLPSSRQEMAIIGPIVRNELFFFITILVLAALLVLFEMKRRQPLELPAAGAARRKALWTVRRERLWMASVYTCSFIFIVMVTAS